MRMFSPKTSFDTGSGSHFSVGVGFVLVLLVAAESSLLAEESPLFFSEVSSESRKIEMRAFESRKGDHSLLVPSDDEAQAYLIVQIAYRRFADNPTDGFAGKLDEFRRVTEAAHELYPASTRIAVLASYARLYAFGTAEALEILLPRVQEWPDHPGMAFVLYRIFSTASTNNRGSTESNREAKNPSRSSDAPKAPAPVGRWSDSKEVSARLAKYWAARIDRESAGRYFTGEVTVAATPLDETERKNVLEDWTQILKWYGLRIASAEARADEVNPLIEAAVAAQAERKAEYDALVADRRRVLKRDLVKLDSLYEAPNSVDEIVDVLSSLRKFRRLLLEDDQHPLNSDAIRKAFPESNEVEVLSAYYDVIVLGKNEYARKTLDGLEADDQRDVRVLYLRTYLALDAEKAEDARMYAGQILEVEPDNAFAKRVVSGPQEFPQPPVGAEPVSDDAPR